MVQPLFDTFHSFSAFGVLHNPRKNKSHVGKPDETVPVMVTAVPVGAAVWVMVMASLLNRVVNVTFTDYTPACPVGEPRA